MVANHLLAKQRNAVEAYTDRDAAELRRVQRARHYYLEEGRLDEAISSFEAALQIQDKLPKYHNNLGLALARSERVDEAMQQYRKALELMPDYPEANNNLANALASRQRYDEAIVYYRRAIEARPEYVKARANLGYILGLLGHVDEGATEVQQILRIDPNSSVARAPSALCRPNGTRYWNHWPGSVKCSVGGPTTLHC